MAEDPFELADVVAPNAVNERRGDIVRPAERSANKLIEAVRSSRAETLIGHQSKWLHGDLRTTKEGALDVIRDVSAALALCRLPPDVTEEPAAKEGLFALGGARGCPD